MTTDCASTGAARTGAVNTVGWEDGRLFGHNTDYEDCAILRDIVRRGVEVDVRLMPRDRSCALPSQLQEPAG